MSIVTEMSAVPSFCPTCGYHAADSKDMIEHWVRSRAYEAGNQDVTLNPWLPHRDPWYAEQTDRVRPQRPAGPTYSDAEEDEEESEPSETGFHLPAIYHVAYLTAKIVGLGALGMLLLTSAFFFSPFVLDSLVSVGPLKPYARLLGFVWEWGLVLLPFLAAAMAVLIVPSLRQRAREIVRKGIVWVGLGVWGVILAGIIFWTVLKVMERVGG